jgi:murein DD-endopeptidase MepM/ murein hydrolase activator NlpD
VSIAVSAGALLLSTIPSASLPSKETKEAPVYPAPPGYLLPWAGGEIHTVTQGEDTPFTHNGRAAYAYDFDLNYDTVVAARAGRVTLVYAGSNQGGCGPAFSGAANYVVIDHGDGTSGLYLHLAYDSTLVHVGDLVRQGQPIAVSGETGLTCSGEPGDTSPGPHLHFQVQQSEQSGAYLTQSRPVTFDDVKGDGIPDEGESYVSGNFGPGKEQKITLTPRRVERVFAPKAVPANPKLLEGVAPTPTPKPSHTPVPDTPQPSPDTSTPAPPPEPTVTVAFEPTAPPVDTPDASPSSEPATAVPGG